ncbi:MAG: type 4a pilus biogenesis protein PilO [Sulfurimonas sp.]|nr:type 4a pilus biogenesis protein PilO [Sulfurimonas sp.]
MSLKLSFENYLQRVDAFFKEKSQKDTYMVYIMIFAVIAVLAYPFYDLSLNEFNDAKKKVIDIKSKIATDELYLKMNPTTKIDKLNMQIKAIEVDLEHTKNDNQYIKEKIETISSLIYDEVSWGKYLNSISINAKRYNMKIINFTNEYADNNESFGHILDITLQVKGNYSNTIRFINSLEKSDLVVDVHNINIKAQDALNTDLDLSVWGITY